MIDENEIVKVLLSVYIYKVKFLRQGENSIWFWIWFWNKVEIRYNFFYFKEKKYGKNEIAQYCLWLNNKEKCILKTDGQNYFV